ncbi:MAG TPA: hypothetical protein ENK21_06530 [Trueperaceae bacterium]|nr:hypothetical protein [Trueperaceae bacterium]
MKIFLTIISLINAIYMLIDGVFVVVNGKYIGPEKPGPWSNFFVSLNINVFKLGPLFVAFGLLWFLFVYGLQASQNWVYWYGIILSIATLWYFPIGSLISVGVIVLLLIYKNKFGI